MIKKTLFSITAEAASEPAINIVMQALQNYGWGAAVLFELMSFLFVLGVVTYTKLQLQDARMPRQRIVLHLLDLI